MLSTFTFGPALDHELVKRGLTRDEVVDILSNCRESAQPQSQYVMYKGRTQTGRYLIVRTLASDPSYVVSVYEGE